MRPRATFRATFVLSIAGLSGVAGCGPEARESGGGRDDQDGADAGCAVAQETACGDGADDDCDGLLDCRDPDCIGIGTCTSTEPPPMNCEVETPSVSFPLPDGTCPEAERMGIPDTDPRFPQYCSAYGDNNAMQLSGFAQGARLTDPSKLVAICVNMEHSWLRDLEIEAYCPSGNKVVLSNFEGRTPVEEVYLGRANDNDNAASPQPGTGYEYCWKPDAARIPMIPYANSGAPMEMWQTGFIDRRVLPAGDYRPSEPFTGFANCELNGPWKVRVVDAWPVDNGFIFSTKIVFDGSLTSSCPVVD